MKQRTNSTITNLPMALDKGNFLSSVCVTLTVRQISRNFCRGIRWKKGDEVRSRMV